MQARGRAAKIPETCEREACLEEALAPGTTAEPSRTSSRALMGQRADWRNTTNNLTVESRENWICQRARTRFAAGLCSAAHRPSAGPVRLGPFPLRRAHRERATLVEPLKQTHAAQRWACAWPGLAACG